MVLKLEGKAKGRHGLGEFYLRFPGTKGTATGIPWNSSASETKWRRGGSVGGGGDEDEPRVGFYRLGEAVGSMEVVWQRW